MPLTPHTYWLNAHSSHLAAPQDDLRPQLKAHGIDSRRSSRFSQLALLGSLGLHIPAHSHILLAAAFHSPGTFLRNFTALIRHQQPSPIDFMANLHNSALFHITQHHRIHGSSLFLAIDGDTLWQPLWLGLNRLMQDPDSPVVIGWAHETPPGRSETEGSIWWQLGSRREHPHSIRLTLAPRRNADHTPPAAHFWHALCAQHTQWTHKPSIALPPHGYPEAYTLTLHQE